MKNFPILVLAASAVLAMTTGCASYRVESNVPSEVLTPMPASGTSSEAPTQAVINVIPRAAISQERISKVLISEDSLPGKKHEKIGPVEVSVKKLTIFHKDPTKEQVDQALREKAAAIGADAVLNVTYKSGIGFTTWGYMDAAGTGVKFEK